MPTTPTDLVTPIPAGADWVDDKWDGEGEKLFTHPAIEVGGATVSLFGVQRANGRTERSIHIRVGDDEADFFPCMRAAWRRCLQNLADTCEILDEIKGGA